MDDFSLCLTEPPTDYGHDDADEPGHHDRAAAPSRVATGCVEVPVEALSRNAIDYAVFLLGNEYDGERTLDGKSAADFAHDAIQKVLLSGGAGRRVHHLDAYVRVAVKNGILDARRRRAPAHESSIVEELAVEEDSTARSRADVAPYRILEFFTQALTGDPVALDVLEVVVIHGETKAARIADVLGAPRKQIYNALERIKRRYPRDRMKTLLETLSDLAEPISDGRVACV